MQPSQQQPSTSRILIVEDDLALQPFWNLVLKRCFDHWRMDWAVSGEEAKSMVQKASLEGQPFALIISDIFLAGSETGLDLMASTELAQSPARFILVSVAEEDRIKDNFRELLQDRAVLTKPLNVPKCERTILQLFGQTAV